VSADEPRDLAPLWTAVALAATLVALGGSVTGSAGFGAGVLVGLVAGAAALLSDTLTPALRTTALAAVGTCGVLFVIAIGKTVAG